MVQEIEQEHQKVTFLFIRIFFPFFPLF